MKSREKTKISDFVLISQQTKKRIAGLIEMKLTPQTIALFAQEYEDYEPEIRLEIVEFIGFLMEQEMERFMAQVKTQVSGESEVALRRAEFEEKARNIRQIQEVLVKPKQIKHLEKPKKQVVLEPKQIRSSEPLVKVSKEKTNSKIDQLIKEAEARERQNEKMAVQQEAQRQKELEKYEKERQNHARKMAKAKEEAQKNEKKVASVKKENTKIDKKPTIKEESAKKANKPSEAEKAAKDNADFLKRQKELQAERERQAKEYARQEAEKEKLWRELYGKSREQSQKQREVAEESHKKRSDEERDKTPKITELKITTYKLFGHTYAIDELIDPKNRVYLFWFKMKQRLGVGNLFAFLEMLPVGKQKKLWKKRMKWLRKIAKSSTTANGALEKEQAINNQTKPEAEKQPQVKENKKSDKKEKTTENSNQNDEKSVKKENTEEKK